MELAQVNAPDWPAPAKLNLFLHIRGRRADGYHTLQTVFQLLDFGDALRFEPRGDGVIRRVADVPGVTADNDLSVQAARLLQQVSGSRLGVDIRIDKTIPIGGGLGGGSSNAATTLVALNTLWGTGLENDRLAELGLRLGADVPVFVHGMSSWAEGIGEKLAPVKLGSPWYVVLSPGVEVSTARVFGEAELTRDTPAITMSAFRAGRTRNDCEPVVRRLYPEVAHALDWLAQFGESRLTGTGACVFAAFDSEQEARSVGARVPARWQAFVARGIDVSPLQRKLAGQAA
jgi:4-diphosphocytidyl-2-C-methyl-D-erythritol kinase